MYAQTIAVRALLVPSSPLQNRALVYPPVRAVDCAWCLVPGAWCLKFGNVAPIRGRFGYFSHVHGPVDVYVFTQLCSSATSAPLRKELDYTYLPSYLPT